MTTHDAGAEAGTQRRLNLAPAAEVRPQPDAAHRRAPGRRPCCCGSASPTCSAPTASAGTASRPSSAAPATHCSPTCRCCSPSASPSAWPASPTAPPRWRPSSATWSSRASATRCRRWSSAGRTGADQLRRPRRHRDGPRRAFLWQRYHRIKLPPVPRVLRRPPLRPDHHRLRRDPALGADELRLPGFDAGITSLGEWVTANSVLGGFVYGTAQPAADPARPAPHPQQPAVVHLRLVHHGQRRRRSTATSRGSSRATRRPARS